MKKFNEIDIKKPVFQDAEYIMDKQILLNKSMEILEVQDAESSRGKYFIVLAVLEGKRVSFSIGGVVFDQLNRNREKLPFEATFTEEKSRDGRLFYSLS